MLEVIREIGVSEEKALKAASALSKRDDRVAQLKIDIEVIKWMMGCSLAMLSALFVKGFLH
jgi:hypothetical protein